MSLCLTGNMQPTSFIPEPFSAGAAEPLRVSAVIPTRNRSPLLRTAIESVLAQTYPIHEIIVVDDCSIDRSAQDVVASIGDTRLLYIRHEKPRGANAARNTGIQRASGEFIAFLDDDDQWLPTKIEKQIVEFERSERIGAVYCGIGGFDVVSGKRLPTKKRVYPSGDLSRILLVKDITAGTPAYVVRRRCFDELGGFDEALPARQDWDMWIRISQAYLIGAAPEVLVLAGQHNGDRVRGNPANALFANRYIYRKYKCVRSKHGIHLRLAALSALLCSEGDILDRFEISRGMAFMRHVSAILVWPPSVQNCKWILRVLIRPHRERSLRSR